MPAASAACQNRSSRNRSSWREAETQERLPSEDKPLTEQRRAAKVQLVMKMQAGQPWQAAAGRAGLPISQSNTASLSRCARTSSGVTPCLHDTDESFPSFGAPSPISGEPAAEEYPLISRILAQKSPASGTKNHKHIFCRSRKTSQPVEKLH
jgi:hypothetical protein